MTITELAIKRPTLIVVIFGALALLGLFSLTRLNYELLPKITPPVLTISTIYPGASPNEVENSVTKPVEDAVSSLDQIDDITSRSNEGVSFVMIQFRQSADVNTQMQLAQQKIDQIVSTLPAGVKTPTISKFELDAIPVLRMGVTSNMPSTQFYQFIIDRIQPRLSEVPGVGQVTLVGGDEREIRINLNADKLKAYGLSILQVLNVIQNSNVDFPTGKLENNSNQLVVRLAGKFSSVDAIRNLIIEKSNGGGDVKLSDVADVEDGHKEYTTINRINGVTSVGILVQKQTDANAVDVSRMVRAELGRIEKDYRAQNIRFNISQDASQFTIDAANGVKFDLMLAVVLVAVVMLLFLHSVRNSFIVMLAIPASILSTFVVMYALGYTLNLMTLLGLSLVVGILVDDSIVVIENIHHHLEKGEEPRVAAVKGRNEIGFAALSITMVDVVIYVPLALTSGLIGNIIREFSVVVVISTLLSLFVSFTVTPLLASRISKIEEMTDGTLIGRFALQFEKYFRRIIANYLQVLKWSLNNRWKVVTISAVLFFAALSLAPLGFIGAEFITQSDRGEFAVTLETPSDYSLDNTNFVTEKVEKYINNLPEVKSDFVQVGASNEGLIGQTSNNSSELDVELVPKEERKKSTDEVGEEIKNFAYQIPGVKVRVNPIGLFGTANQTPIQLIVNSSNREDVLKSAEILERVVKSIPGTADVRLSTEAGNPEMRVDIDRQKLANFGLSIVDVGAALQVAMQGNDDAKFRDGNDDYNILVSLDKFDRSKISDLKQMTFINNRGQSIQLQQFAGVYQSTGPTSLQRFDRVNAVTVYSQVIGRPTGSVGEDIKNAMAKEKIPSGVDIAYWGDLKNQSDAFGSLGLALVAAIIFVYLVMVALYDSYIDPFVILFSIPVAMVGAFLALALTMKSLNIFSILGIIMLVGLVGKNAILLVDRTNQKRREDGLSIYDALIEAGESRIRPILMTTTAMVIGMLPLALSTDSGSEWKTGLAWGIIGGLLSSMFLTLILVPVVYVIVERVQLRIKVLFAGRKKETVRELQPEVVKG
ncbi:MAG TPA: efflux RND transporter permease subunit [Candidatus Acidoferrales bacterium]|nr:efflux RND transporter permease subunit [Candidatus Acidoferrales bacterium]